MDQALKQASQTLLLTPLRGPADFPAVLGKRARDLSVEDDDDEENSDCRGHARAPTSLLTASVTGE